MPSFGSFAPGGASMMSGPSGGLPQTAFDNIMPMLSRILQQRGSLQNGVTPTAPSAPAPAGAQPPGLINRALGMQPGVGLLNGLFGMNKPQAQGSPQNITPQIPVAGDKAPGQTDFTGMW
jgi:hypothetical protein